MLLDDDAGKYVLLGGKYELLGGKYELLGGKYLFDVAPIDVKLDNEPGAVAPRNCDGRKDSLELVTAVGRLLIY